MIEIVDTQDRLLRLENAIYKLFPNEVLQVAIRSLHNYLKELESAWSVVSGAGYTAEDCYAYFKHESEGRLS